MADEQPSSSAGEGGDEVGRWQLLLDAVVTMAADLSLDELLSRITRTAARLADAKYAAIGVLGSGGERRLRTFVTHGLTQHEIDAIGEPPRGLGVLGQLIDRPEPLRLHHISEHPASYGFPPNHPPMGSFLGVPIRTRDKVFGNLYLAEKHGPPGTDFTEEDERIVIALAAAAGVAIENSRLLEEAGRRERWLAATAELSSTLMGDVGEREALQLVADLARQVSRSDLAWIITGPDDESLQVKVVSGTEVDEDALDSLTLVTSLAGATVRTGQPAFIEDLSSEEGARSKADLLDIDSIGPTMLVPLREADTQGVLALAWRHESAEAARDVDLTLPAAFARQAALALHLSRGHEDRRRIAVYEDRDRIGRDLHDVVIQRLFAIGLDLQGGLRNVEDPKLSRRLDRAVEEIDDTIRDIRRTIFELGNVNASGDVQSEVTQLVARAASSLKFKPTLAFEGPVRLRTSATMVPEVVAVLAEALSNTARHARATEVSVLLSVGGDRLTLTVTDNGVGIPADVAESGLANMRERAKRLGGDCVVSSGPAPGTVVLWAVPLS